MAFPTPPAPGEVLGREDAATVYARADAIRARRAAENCAYREGGYDVIMALIALGLDEPTREGLRRDLEERYVQRAARADAKRAEWLAEYGLPPTDPGGPVEPLFDED